LSAQLRTVFRQDDRIAAQSRLRRIPEAFGLNPTLVQQLHEWEDSILACYDLPPRHRGRVNAASCLSAARREIEGHCQVIGIFPNRLSLLRLSGVMLEEHNDEWLAGPRYVGRRADHDPAVKPGGAGALHAGGVAARTLLRVVQAA
ncbi:MAG TPA: transposase, partial [Candidatus Limnocylindrales bacterium]|nr:transposase [Candidatus Limnocylindrales bacterium]